MNTNTHSIETTRILVIDDDELLSYLFAETLTPLGEVSTANNGEDGIELARELRPDLIVLDVEMPGLDGFEVIEQLREDRELRSIPVMFVTGESHPEIETFCLETGAVDYLAKPVNVQVLAARAQKHLVAKRREDSLVAKSLRDQLTDAHSRHAFDERLPEEVLRCRRAGTDLSLMLVNLDSFARYNERHGYIAGDEVIRVVANTIMSVASRPGDFVARKYGKEFAVIMPNTTIEAAEVIASKICRELRALDLVHVASTFDSRVTVSIGVAGLDPEMTADELLDAADHALYTAKRCGRNRIRRASGGGVRNKVLLSGLQMVSDRL